MQPVYALAGSGPSWARSESFRLLRRLSLSPVLAQHVV